MSDAPPPEDFRSQVQRLVAAGKLTPEEAQGLLEGTETEPMTVAHYVRTVQEGTDAAPNLLLRVTGYGLTVVHDPALSAPQLSANREDELSLTATPDGWTLERIRRGESGWNNLKAMLTLPFTPQHVKAEIQGGHLTLPDIGGEMRAEVNGGHVRMGHAASLWAEVNGGNLNAEQISGPAHLNVNGGNLALAGAQGVQTSLNASINGGNLKWAGVLQSGDHRLEVNAGNATLHLLAGSSLRIDADVTVGSFKADFPTQKQGSFVTTRHQGQLGGGEAFLSCKVAAGQVKLVTQ